MWMELNWIRIWFSGQLMWIWQCTIKFLKTRDIWGKIMVISCSRKTLLQCCIIEASEWYLWMCTPKFGTTCRDSIWGFLAEHVVSIGWRIWHSGCTWFESRPTHWISWLRFLKVFFGHSTYKFRRIPQIYHDSFFPNPYQFINFQSTIIQCYIWSKILTPWLEIDEL